MKALRLAVPLVLAAFMLTCQGDQPTAPDNADSRATFKKGKPPPGPSPDLLDYYVEQVRARLSRNGDLSVRVVYKNASTVSCGTSTVPLEVTTSLLDPIPKDWSVFCYADVCDEPGGSGETFRCSGAHGLAPGVYEIRAELKDGVDSEDPKRDNFGYYYVEIP